MPRIVVIGGGSAGINLAQTLARTLKPADGVEVVLLEKSAAVETLAFDYLVIATGSTYTVPIKPDSKDYSRASTESKLARVREAIEAADKILIVGGGAVGCEVAGEIASRFPNKSVTILEAREKLIAGNNLRDKFHRKLSAALAKLQINVILGERLEERLAGNCFEKRMLRTNKGTEIDSDIQLLCGGFAPRGFVKVNDCLQFDGAAFAHMFALGDASNHATPKLGYWAGEQGNVVGDMMTRMIKGKDFFAGKIWGDLGAVLPKPQSSFSLSFELNAMATPGSPSAPRAAAASKTPCSFFAQGKCRKGATCGFYHAPREDLAKSPLPCKFFLQNACTAGRACKFSHVTDAAQQSSLTVVSASTGDKSVAPGAFRVHCKFFKNGACAAGDKCPYVHQVAKSVSSSGSHKTTAKRTSAVTMHVLSPNPKAHGDEHEEKPAAQTAVSEDAAEQHLSDFISKEEELFYYGAPGEFAASDMAAPPQHSGPSKTCTYFLQGLCRYGDSCFYLHALREDVDTEDDMLEIGRELQASAELECNICYDNILQKEERFGLLSGCTHAFCLSCVRNWRGTADQPKQTVRQCPVCRVETLFVIPSSRMVTSEARKKALVDTYRKNLAAIPCRHFSEGRGTCPFGTSCFYAHRYPDGTLDARVVRTAVDADGHYDVLRQARLAHFFQNGA
ncbi:hypothetical protein PybrP1_002300 [[Pythium] brassicae (nom. inval.)]|nr:hypothetical protein PybrP1_002300 [[Pythium] brassicae (nom. inval.)]